MRLVLGMVLVELVEQCSQLCRTVAEQLIDQRPELFLLLRRQPHPSQVISRVVRRHAHMIVTVDDHAVGGPAAVRDPRA